MKSRLASLLLLIPLQFFSVAEADTPNIILILADDLGYGDLGCYGQQRIATPNIDRLAAEGMRFTQHYSGSTVCAPSRSALLTGQHTGRTPVRGNREHVPEGQHPLPRDAITVAEILRGAGYRTGAFGKWGLGFVDTEGAPHAQGFDVFFGHNCQRMAHRCYPPYLWDNDRQEFLRGNDTYTKGTYAPDVIHDRALEFIRSSKGRPFFLFLPYTTPHAELAAPDDELLEAYRGRWPETPFDGESHSPGATAAYGSHAWHPSGYAPQEAPRATFAAMVSRLDRQVGEIVRLVDAMGLRENTLILFTSDNGPHQEGGADPEFFDSNGPYRGHKRDLYEGGIRVPLIARWPGRVTAGSVNHHISAFWDFLPTFAELSGEPVPTRIDGLSLVPTLLGREAEQRQHDYLYWEFSERPAQAVRAGRWKGIRRISADGALDDMQLFDLIADPGETRDLAADHPDIVASMAARMTEAHQRDGLWLLPFER